MLGLVGAFAAAVAYGAASVFQAIGARRTAASASSIDPRLLVRLLHQAPYVLGLALDSVGFAGSVLALRTLPLFLVQAAVAASIGVTALLAATMLGVSLHRRERLALLLLGSGLGLLAVAAQPGQVAPLSLTGRWALLLGVAVPLALGAATPLAGPAGRSALLATGAGLAFGGVGIAARVLAVPDPLWRIVTEPVPYALCAYGILGTLLYAGALQRGSVTTATAITFVAETVIPAGIGLALLGDATRAGFHAVAAAGFVLSVGGALALARHAEPSAQVAAPT